MALRTVVFALFTAAAVCAQPLTFEVASVKPSSMDNASHPATNGPASLSLHRATLKLMIASAYDVPMEQVFGGSAWTGSEMFDIEAKASAASTQSQKMEMLRNLLADRFQLTIHREPRTLSAYVLVVAKDGPKIHPAKVEDPRPAGKPGVLAMRISTKQFATIIAMYLGDLTFPAPGTPPLTAPTPLPVVDQTGLTGDYDIVLDLTRVNDWFAVLEPQLGLKLEARKLPVDAVVIDNAVKPLGN